MRHVAVRVVAVGLFLAVAASLAMAAGGGVQVALTAHRLTTDPDGREVLVAADEARPGEVIEYRARYSNGNDQAARQVVATLPIPHGTEYLPRTADPAPLQASLDGRTFAPVPLQRKVRLANGRLVTREVPTSEYRYLRWTLGELKAHQSQDVRARVRITAAGPPEAAAKSR